MYTTVTTNGWNEWKKTWRTKLTDKPTPTTSAFNLGPTNSSEIWIEKISLSFSFNLPSSSGRNRMSVPPLSSDLALVAVNKARCGSHFVTYPRSTYLTNLEVVTQVHRMIITTIFFWINTTSLQPYHLSIIIYPSFICGRLPYIWFIRLLVILSLFHHDRWNGKATH